MQFEIQQNDHMYWHAACYSSPSIPSNEDIAQFTLLGSLYLRQRELRQQLLALGHALCVLPDTDLGVD